MREIVSAEELTQVRGAFLGTVAHELRSSVGLIKDYAATLLAPDGPRDEETLRRCLSVVLEASSELQELVDQVLDLSRVTVGAFEIEPRALRLAPLVRAAVARVSPRSTGHRLRLELPTDLPLVLADPRRLGQVFANLLDNAIKFSPGGGQITIAAEQDRDEVVVRVSDTGFGLSPGELGNVFEHFYRGPGARARRIHGDGLGLAICKGIVEAHGGRIWAESPAGRPDRRAAPGTTVYFTLPLAAAPRGPRRVYRVILALLLLVGQAGAVADLSDGDGLGLEKMNVEWAIDPERGHPSRYGLRVRIGCPRRERDRRFTRARLGER